MIDPRFRLLRHDTVGSTQDTARALLPSAPASGTIVVAREQLAGRGRQGRSWASPADRGLWCTLIHRSGRPTREWPALTAVAAVAVADSLRALGEEPAIKWPNDVLLAGRKVAGLLADVEAGAVLIGIGVDLLQREADFPQDLRGAATSVALERGKRGEAPVAVEVFLERLLPALGDRLERFESSGPEEALRDAWAHSSLRNREVILSLPDGARVSGRAVGLGPAGEIVLDCEGGRRAIASGTVLSGAFAKGDSER